MEQREQHEMSLGGSISGLFSTLGPTREPVDGFVKVVEGSTAVLFPPAQGSKKATATTAAKESAEDGDEMTGGGGEDQSIFYNPAQVVNRDLSIAALEVFSRMRRTEPARKGGVTEAEGITILEALSATGLRALRYWNEISGVRYVIANDMDADAVECIRRNAAYNGVPLVNPSVTSNTGELNARDHTTNNNNNNGSSGMEPTDAPQRQRNRGVIPNHDDAIVLMQRLALSPAAFSDGSRLAVVAPPPPPEPTSLSSPQSSSGATNCVLRPLLQQELVDVVDLDPYGTASPFLDAAFSCIKEGGLMLVTSTDSPILCGNYPDTCHAKYNSIMMKPAACHEVAVRILLAAAERVANKHRKYIVPLLSLHIDFYVRVFFRVYTQAAETKLATVKLAHVAHCVRCPAFWISPMGCVRSSRKERARRREAAKRCRGAGATSEGVEAGVGKDGTEDRTETVADGTAQPQRRSAAYPAPPDRSTPFKISCPTLDQWLPNDGSGGDDKHHCPACGGHIAVGGPIYAAPTQNVEFLSRVLDLVEERAAEGRLTAVARVRGLVQAAMDELPNAPLFYSLPDIASLVRVRCPPTPIFVGAISRLGYRCSQVHCDPSGLKTTCPPETLISAMLTFKEIQATKSAAAAGVELSDAVMKEGRGDDGTDASRQGVTTSLRLQPIHSPPLDFSYDKVFDFRSVVTGVAKFVPNAPGWGPKARHRGVAHDED